MKTWLIDTAERVGVSFAATLLVYVTAGGDLVDLASVNWGQALSMSGGVALVSLLKALIATEVGDPNSAALLPSAGRHSKP